MVFPGPVDGLIDPGGIFDDNSGVSTHANKVAVAVARRYAGSKKREADRFALQ
jgi:hypothetical protein